MHDKLSEWGAQPTALASVEAQPDTVYTPTSTDGEHLSQATCDHHSSAPRNLTLAIL
jgi:hypothetical protein